jgi:hypothetical protein
MSSFETIGEDDAGQDAAASFFASDPTSVNGQSRMEVVAYLAAHGIYVLPRDIAHEVDEAASIELGNELKRKGKAPKHHRTVRGGPYLYALPTDPHSHVEG